MELPKRKPTRLKRYDYSTPGAYFITVCTHNRKQMLSPLRHRSIVDKAIGYLKMNSSRMIHQKGFDETIWQRSYHDHIIRGEEDYKKVWKYIDANVLRWKEDCFYEERQ